MAPRGALRNLGLILVLLLAAASPTLAWRRRSHRDCGRGEGAAAVPPPPPCPSPPSSRGELGLFPAFVSAPPRDHPEPAPEPTFRSPPPGGGASGDCCRCAPGSALHLLRVPAPALLPLPPPPLSHPQESAPRGPDGPALFSHETKALTHSVVERPGCCPAPQEAAPQGAEQPAPLRAHRSSSRVDCCRCAPGSALHLLRVPAPALLPMPPPLLSHPQESAPLGPDGPALFSHETKALTHSVVERPGCCPAPQEAAPRGAEQPAPLRAHRSGSRGDCYRCAPGSAVCLLRVPAPAPRGRGSNPSTAVCPTLFGLIPSVAHPTSTSLDWLLPSWLVLPPLLRACAGRSGLATVLGPG